MSAFDLAATVERATRRFGPRSRAARKDRGASRLHARVEGELARLLAVVERPSLSEVSRRLAAYCRGQGLEAPSRATLYNAIERLPVPAYRWEDLPPELHDALYNMLPNSGSVPGDHLVYYAFNHGNPRALSFASALPWLCLWRALQRRGWRPKSKALLLAVAKHRGIVSRAATTRSSR